MEVGKGFVCDCDATGKISGADPDNILFFKAGTAGYR